MPMQHNSVFSFLYDLVEVFKAYFGGEFHEQAIRSNFVLIYELFDEVMDHGYPQIVSVDLLKQYIHHGDAKELPQQAKQVKEITQNITGAVPWRPAGKYFYPKNEVYLDVIEQVNVIVTQQGRKLSSSCEGKIVMKSQLSGMPECKFGLNDKISMLKRREARGGKPKELSDKSVIDLEDVVFHPSVKLNKYDENKTISFIPPDGEFKLMTYRIKKCNLPFDVSGMVSERGRNRVEYHVKLKAKYENFNVAQDIIVNVPVPSHTSACNVKTTTGKCKYEPTKSAMVWRIPKLAGNQQVVLKGDVSLTHLIQDKPWAKPPITMQFTIPMWPSSGIKVRFLNIQEKLLNYKSIKWVRYLTTAGDYQIRI